jgi:hypothetical protein
MSCSGHASPRGAVLSSEIIFLQTCFSVHKRGWAAVRLRVAIVGMFSVAGVVLAGCSSGSPSRGVQVPSVDPPSSAPPSVSIGTPTSTSTGDGSPTSVVPPVPKVLDSAAVRDGVRRVLTESFKLTGVQDVSCPPGEPVAVGTSFDCDATVAGKPRTVTITVKTAEGQYEVAAPK